MRVDGKGNVYVAIYGQGRVLVFNNKGIPIGQILLPEREKGLNLLSTSLDACVFRQSTMTTARWMMHLP